MSQIRSTVSEDTEGDMSIDSGITDILPKTTKTYHPRLVTYGSTDDVDRNFSALKSLFDGVKEENENCRRIVVRVYLL